MQNDYLCQAQLENFDYVEGLNNDHKWIKLGKAMKLLKSKSGTKQCTALLNNKQYKDSDLRRYFFNQFQLAHPVLSSQLRSIFLLFLVPNRNWSNRTSAKRDPKTMWNVIAFQP